MLYVAVGAVVVILALLALLFYVIVSFNGQLTAREEAWRAERFELQERIRAPDRKPQPARVPRPPRDDADRPNDLTAMARVGTVTPLRVDREA